MKLSTFVLILLLATSNRTIAQGVSVGPQGVKLMGYGDIDVEKTMERWDETTSQRIDALIDLQVECLTQQCALTPTQVDKLQLAKSGIVKRKVASGLEQLKRFMIESELIEGDLPTVSKMESADKLLISGARKDTDTPGVVLFRTTFEKPLFEQSLWQGVLKSNLSSQQFEQYVLNCRTRNSNFVETALDYGIAEIDGAVCLTEQQRTDIEAKLKDLLLSQVTVSFPTNADEATALVQPTLADRTLIDPVLSERQRNALDDYTNLKNWVGVGWKAR